ncbi:MAG: hypothetical protein WAK29_12825 [Terriglobales bacterium]
MNRNRPLWVELTSGMASVHRKVNTYGESSAIDLVGKDTQSEGLVDSLVEAGEQLEQTFPAGNVSYYNLGTSMAGNLPFVVSYPSNGRVAPVRSLFGR